MEEIGWLTLKKNGAYLRTVKRKGLPLIGKEGKSHSWKVRRWMVFRGREGMTARKDTPEAVATKQVDAERRVKWTNMGARPIKEDRTKKSSIKAKLERLLCRR